MNLLYCSLLYVPMSLYVHMYKWNANSLFLNEQSLEVRHFIYIYVSFTIIYEYLILLII